MTNFLDKLKKGMDAEESFDEPKEITNEPESKNIEPIKSANSEQRTVNSEEKTANKKKNTEPVVTFASMPIATKKTLKTKKTKKTPLALAKTELIDQSVQQKPVKEARAIKIEKIENTKNEEPRQDKKWFESEGELTVDVYQTDEEIVIQSAIAGMDAEDLDIFIENDLVSIKGNRAKPFSNEKKSYFYQECYWGPFSREIILPEEVDPSRINATMKQGVLTIRIPKVERERKRKVRIAK